MTEEKNKWGKGSVALGKDGYWKGKIYIGKNPITGRNMYKSFCSKSKTTVERDMKSFRANLSVNKEAMMEQFPVGDLTLTEGIKNWEINVKQLTLKPESFRRLNDVIDYYITPKIGHFKVGELTREIVQNGLINPLFREGYSLSTIKKAYSAMNDYMNFWRKEEMAKTYRYVPNVMELVTIPAAHRFKKKDIKAMEDSEIERFLKKLYEKDSKGGYVFEYADLINLILQTGMRLGEACALEISDYDREAKCITISKNVVETNNPKIKGTKVEYEKRTLLTQSSPKTKSGYRRIPLNETAIKALERLIDRAHIFTEYPEKIAINSKGEQIWPSNLVRTINRIYKHENIKLTGAHSLRHTYATALFNQGIDIKTVSSLLGHSGIQITSDTYVHNLQTMNFGIRKELKFKPYPEYLLKEAN